ncbi:hypothetical protein BASA81_002495 [Batrachochytrium salamandrivorans]|nr:hypothetical protein BASA81_002495 [Batrachochytrium salamandrivorans]
MKLSFLLLVLLLVAVALGSSDDDEFEEQGDVYQEDYSPPEDDDAAFAEPESVPLETLQDLDRFLSKENHFGGGALGLFSIPATAQELEYFLQLARGVVPNGIPFAHSTALELLNKYSVLPGQFKVFVHPVPRFVSLEVGDKTKMRYGGGTQSLGTPEQRNSLTTFLFEKYLPLVARLSQVNEFIYTSNDLPVLVLVMRNGESALTIHSLLTELRAVALTYKNQLQFAWAEEEDLDMTSAFAVEELVNPKVTAMIKPNAGELYTLVGEQSTTQGLHDFIQAFLHTKLSPAPTKRVEKNINLEL